nr:Trk system potassium transporter TrkA [Dehalococcoidales bacterium]
EVNMVACYMAKEMGAHRTVARIREAHVRAPLTIGSGRKQKVVVRTKSMVIDFTITPEQVVAEEIARVMRRTCAVAVEEFGEGRIEMAELRVDRPLAGGRWLQDISFPRPCVVAAIVRQGQMIIPHGHDAIEPGDHVHLIAARESMSPLMGMFGASESVMRNAIIFGGGRIGMRTAKLLDSIGIRVKIIEKSIERSRQLASELDRVLVIHGEGTDSAFLREEGVGEADGFVSATGRDELNVLAGLLAKKMGAKRTVVIVNKPEYVSLVEEVGIDTAVNPLTLTANAILRFVRRGQIISVARLEGDGAEAIELLVGETYKHLGRRLRDADLPKDVLIGAVVRNNRVLIPDGNTTIEEGDRVVVICTPQAIPAVERHFE